MAMSDGVAGLAAVVNINLNRSTYKGTRERSPVLEYSSHIDWVYRESSFLAFFSGMMEKRDIPFLADAAAIAAKPLVWR